MAREKEKEKTTLVLFSFFICYALKQYYFMVSFTCGWPVLLQCEKGLLCEKS